MPEVRRHNAQGPRQLATARTRDKDRAAGVRAPDPAELEQAAGERAAGGAGEVVALLAPIDAVAQRITPWQVDAELGKHVAA
jgi:hypothetical protein